MKQNTSDTSTGKRLPRSPATAGKKGTTWAAALLPIVGLASLLLLGCAKKTVGPKAEPAVIIPASTKILDDATQALLTTQPEADTLRFSSASPQVAALRANDVIVGTAGLGFLKRVLSIQDGGGQVIVVTRPAALNEAIERGALDFTQHLSPASVERVSYLAPGVTMSPAAPGGDEFVWQFQNIVIYDGDGNDATVFDQIVAKGEIRLRPDLECHVAFDNFQLKSMVVKLATHQVNTIEVRTGIGLHARREVELTRFNITPFTVFIGPVPVVFTPEVILYAGVDGRISADIESSVSSTSDYTAGLSYTGGTWTALKAAQMTHTYVPPHVTTNCEAKAFVGPRMQLLVYGVAGPYVQADGFLKLEADPLATPWWRLLAGIEAGVGVKLEAFSRTLVNYSDDAVLSQSVVIAEASGPPGGTLGGVVRDAVSNSPLEGTSVTATRSGSSYSVVTDALGLYRLDLPTADDYTLTFTRTGYLAATYFGVAVRTGLETQLETVLQVDQAHATTGTVGGRMADALNNASLPGVTVKLRAGLNNSTGSVVTSTMTDFNGVWTVTNLAAGNYTAEGTLAGYLPAYVTVTCIGNASSQAPDGVLTPILLAGEVRIVLSWGETPSDLDSHMSGPLSDGTRFHMFYPYSDGNSGSPWPDYVHLDLDDVTSYGPETTTLRYQLPGTYRFLVHDYSDRSSTASTALGYSEAQVRVYDSTGFRERFLVPFGQPGTLWTVFEMQSAEIRPINTMEYKADPSGILLAHPAFEKTASGALVGDGRGGVLRGTSADR